MNRVVQLRGVTIFVFLLALALMPLTSVEAKKKKKAMPKGVPVLWQEPTDIASRDLYYGPGGRAMYPDLSRVTYLEDQKSGTQTKYRVRDAAGRIWIAKLGSESQAETAATRLLWAVGYPTEITYLWPRVNIRGKGTFENVRFEARPKSVKRLDDWEWEKNPFVGTREFQGLKVMMALLNNWDIKDVNNEIIHVRNPRTGRSELQYIISDLGATFGKTGSFLTRSRNEPVDYSDAEFIDEIKGNLVDFHYSGKRKELFRDITISDAKWIAGWLAKLSDRQIRDAFRAAYYSPQEIDLLSRTVRARINRLLALPSSNPVVRTNR